MIFITVKKSSRKETQYKSWANKDFQWKMKSFPQLSLEKWASIQVKEYKKTKTAKNSWNLVVQFKDLYSRIVFYSLANKMKKIKKIKKSKNSKVVFLIKLPQHWHLSGFPIKINTIYSRVNHSKISTLVLSKILFPWVKNKRTNKSKKWKLSNKTN